MTPELAEFIAERDSLYLGTANADGQPYIQHRGGPKGFLKVLYSSRMIRDTQDGPWHNPGPL